VGVARDHSTHYRLPASLDAHVINEVVSQQSQGAGGHNPDRVALERADASGENVTSPAFGATDSTSPLSRWKDRLIMSSTRLASPCGPRTTQKDGASVQPPLTQTSQLPPSAPEQIAVRAHELFVERGRGHGHDWDDWLQAAMVLGASGLAQFKPEFQ